jgi:hypothetical protein
MFKFDFLTIDIFVDFSLLLLLFKVTLIILEVPFKLIHYDTIDFCHLHALLNRYRSNWINIKSISNRTPKESNWIELWSTWKYPALVSCIQHSEQDICSKSDAVMQTTVHFNPWFASNEASGCNHDTPTHRAKTSASVLPDQMSPYTSTTAVRWSSPL